jgi:hypothetical protein
MKNTWLVILALATAFATASAAKADAFHFNVKGNGITGSGAIAFSPTATPGVDKITGITGIFSDASAGIANATIESLVPASYSSANPSEVPAASGYVWEFDNLFYPTGEAPGVNGYPAGGLLDNWGVLFELSDGLEVNLWGDGGNLYTAGDSAGLSTGPFSDFGTYVSFAETPEPPPLLLIGTGLLFLAGFAFRKTGTHKAKSGMLHPA